MAAAAVCVGGFCLWWSCCCRECGTAGHKADNFTVKNNGSKDTRITGAELGDTFTITATVENTNITDTLKVTVGADNSANVASGKSTSETADHALREILDYDR